MVHWMTNSHLSRGTQPRSAQQEHINTWLTKITLEETKPEDTNIDDYLTSQLLITQNDWLQSTTEYMSFRLEVRLALTAYNGTTGANY